MKFRKNYNLKKPEYWKEKQSTQDQKKTKSTC